MNTRACALALIPVVVLAGCSFTLDTGTTHSTTPGVEQETPSTTPTPNESALYPPGIDEAGIDNVSALLDAHTAALNQTGYVASGSGNTTVLRSGFLVNVTRSSRFVVVEGSQRYFDVRRTRAGPVERLVQRYSNGTTEFRRLETSSGVSYRALEPQNASELAGVEYLDAFLRGGNFTLTDVRDDGNTTTVVLEADGFDNETALLGGLPENAEEIRTYEATAWVDSHGRVQRLNATVGFVIGGANRSHRVTFDLRRIGVANLTEPDWIEAARGNTDGDGNQSASGDRRGNPDGTVRATGEDVAVADRRSISEDASRPVDPVAR